MKCPSIDEEIFELLRSAFTFEKSLSQYLTSACVLIESQIKTGHDESIGGTIHSILNHVNELQKLIYSKITIVAERFSDIEVCTIFQEHEHYEYLNKDCFLDIIDLLYSHSNNCTLREWKRNEIKNEVEHAYHIYKKRKNILKTYHFYNNDTKTVWLAGDAARPNNSITN